MEPKLVPSEPLTGFDLEGVGVLLLDGVGEVEAGVAAVVGQRVLRQHVGEVKVPVVALGHALVLRDRLHGCGRAAGIQGRAGFTENGNDGGMGCVRCGVGLVSLKE